MDVITTRKWKKYGFFVGLHLDYDIKRPKISRNSTRAPPYIIPLPPTSWYERIQIYTSQLKGGGSCPWVRYRRVVFRRVVLNPKLPRFGHAREIRVLLIIRFPGRRKQNDRDKRWYLTLQWLTVVPFQGFSSVSTPTRVVFSVFNKAIDYTPQPSRIST